MTTDQMTVEGALYRKLAEVVQEVSGVEKDGRNDFHKYDYTTAEAMLRAIRGPLTARNVVLMPSVTDVAEREITTSKGATSTVTTIHLTFTLVDGDSGQMHTCSWAGQGDDPADKGLGKAYTNAIKTFLREQFLLPMGDDPEADSRTDERAAQRTGNGAPSRSYRKPGPGVVPTGKSDVTQEDPWVERTVQALEEHGITKQLREKLTELGHAPAANAGVKRTLNSLAPSVRDEIDVWIDSQNTADVPFV